MTGEITVKNGAGETDLLHFKFCTKSEFIAGEVKQGLGYKPFEQLQYSTELAVNMHGALLAAPQNNLSPNTHGIEESLALLDTVADEDKEKVMEVANKSMGFIGKAMEILTTKVLAMQAEMEAGKNGKNAGKKG